ncbi:alpha-glucuronidase family glycosyl hydrolase [Paenibacillus aceris]|uniref:Xylan alpha-1,2-glucuronidase n=1 Tax=Paenibacillus aceris TaxID=869555 RepID=A0ABS4HUD3_9BACL|nr:alpha-glucuronidase family glycosyl hydrolase [Paenibacillus aceris]MBP1962233.1 alpha-glucuronidase [Paenibacillus aceris]NHW37061.1 alpha-glucuronidase [Paenibacillus aceris]
MSDTKTKQTGYHAWLEFHPIAPGERYDQYAVHSRIVCTEKDEVIRTAVQELSQGIGKLLGKEIRVAESDAGGAVIALGTFGGGNALVDRTFGEETRSAIKPEGFAIKIDQASGSIVVGASSTSGVLYGAFHLLRLFSTKQAVNELDVIENPVNMLRMINQWDNIDGSIERGYAGKSIFFENNRITTDLTRVRDYARLLASSGLNAISINNVNVHKWESKFITGEYLPDVAKVAAVFRSFSIKLFLSVNYASPLEIGGLSTADPLDPAVREWWRAKAAEVYAAIPDFGGFLVKADSENRPGPFTYDRDHADGSNMLAEALKPYGGIVIWRCFVYNCKQDWRDRATDRARAAYDHFKPLDGRFMDNVILQVKNGPMDFQVREPVSPLIGAMETTNQMIEFQITQEYTGQQRHLCYLVPQWKEVLDFETYAKGEGSSIKRIVDGSLHGNKLSGFAAVSNIGDDVNWTGHLLAQANLYGYGRLAWNPDLSAEEIAEEWIRMTFGGDEKLVSVVMSMLMDSWSIYEAYTSPLGVGWMVNPDHHYGPNVDGYEYSKWGTYHFADCHGIGVDRTKATGTGYAAQYKGANYDTYESVESCPDELLLFFHHVPYTHVLHSGQTVIQHIYNTHFEGVERAEQLVARWASLEGSVGELVHKHVGERLAEQAGHAKEWRDMINTYFFRKSGIADALGRKIY